ncbi:CoA transferase [Dietzia aurantiaca]|uniref:CoA transferase n=1 Tax=Dietzia aurantiaca TaxID=983873 RepID=A0ABV9PMP2_9ACTN
MESSASRLWARSGAMWLTGTVDGPPRLAPGRPAAHLAGNLERFARDAARWGPGPTDLPDARLLGERAALAGLSRQGPLSCGGAFRTVRTRDGHLGLSLARPADLELLPALTGNELADPWESVAAWAREVDSAEADERVELLGLPGGLVPAPGTRVSARPAALTRPGGRREVIERPLVVDFTSLWAGPLCAHLLGLAGATVIKVESRSRPDGSRRGPKAFFDLLHAGHRALSVDPSDPRHRVALAALVSRADLVLEASRPDALARWGLDAEAAVAGGTSWLSITARGRSSRRVGFGDDVAVGAGLYVHTGDDDNDRILPCADAIGDPLTGVLAASAAASALAGDRAQLIDVSMHDTCAEAACDPDLPKVPGPPEAPDVRFDGQRWWLDTGTGRTEIRRPHARRHTGTAPALGADDSTLLP